MDWWINRSKDWWIAGSLDRWIAGLLDRCIDGWMFMQKFNRLSVLYGL